MNRIIFSQPYFIASLLLVALVSFSCGGGTNDGRLPTDLIQNPNSAEGTQNVKLPAFEFEQEFHDFGRVIQGEQVSFAFKFKNSGDASMLISNVRSSCGCAVASFPDQPLEPGDEGVISVQFDSRGRRGSQVKTVTLVANTQPNTKQLTIQANVITPESMNN
jgi:hypothetical protein